MYELRVFLDGAASPTELRRIARASDVLATVPQLLQKHRGCSHIEVFQGAVRLFAVDCDGQRMAE